MLWKKTVAPHSTSTHQHTCPYRVIHIKTCWQQVAQYVSIISCGIGVTNQSVVDAMNYLAIWLATKTNFPGNKIKTGIQGCSNLSVGKSKQLKSFALTLIPGQLWEGSYTAMAMFKSCVKEQSLPVSTNADAHELEQDPVHSVVEYATVSFPGPISVSAVPKANMFQASLVYPILGLLTFCDGFPWQMCLINKMLVVTLTYLLLIDHPLKSWEYHQQARMCVCCYNYSRCQSWFFGGFANVHC